MENVYVMLETGYELLDAFQNSVKSGSKSDYFLLL